MLTTKNLIKLLAIGYLWDQTDGKVTHDALRSFSAGAEWAIDFLSGQTILLSESSNKQRGEDDFKN